MNKAIVSKINWTAGIMALIGLAAAFGFIPAAAEPHMNTIVGIVLPLAIMVFRTWFTDKRG